MHAYVSAEPKYRQYLHDLFRGGMLYDSSENRLDEYANHHKIQQLHRVNTWRSWRTAGLPGGLRTWSWMQDALEEVNQSTLAWIAGPAGAYTAKDHHFSAGQKIEKQIVLINDTRQPQDFVVTWTATVDPNGETRNMLANLGYTARAWNGAAAPLVVVGRNVLVKDSAVATKLESYVLAGGRALICAHDPQWMTEALGWRVCPNVSRRVFPMDSPVTRGIDAEDLRDWAGSSTLELEDCVVADPAARRMAGRVMDYALHSPLSPRVGRVVYIGGALGATWLDKIEVSYERSATLDNGAELLLIGPDAEVAPSVLNAYLEAGGKVFFLPRSQAAGWFGTTFKPAQPQFAGSLSTPEWPEARGLSSSDLRWRSYLDVPPWILSTGAEIGADGLIGRKRIGNGVAIFCPVDPDCYQADEKTYFRTTRWRATRAVAQLLANLGASFPVDSGIFHPLDIHSGSGGFVSSGGVLRYTPGGDRSGRQSGTGPQPLSEGVQPHGHYHPDYRTDFPMGDNPYRYYRW